MTHYCTWINHQMAVPCGATGERTLSSQRAMVDCPDCLRLSGQATGSYPRQPAERYTPTERRELRDAGRRHWNA